MSPLSESGSYPAIVRAAGRPNRRPSRSFIAVLLVLDKLERSYAHEMIRYSGVDGPATRRILARMYYLGLVTREPEATPAVRRREPRVYLALTPRGQKLVEWLRRTGAA